MTDEEPTPPGGIRSTKTYTNAPAPAQRIGSYRILQKIGEGGMGEVYLAEQDKPVRRRVALKVIKGGFIDSVPSRQGSGKTRR